MFMKLGAQLSLKWKLIAGFALLLLVFLSVALFNLAEVRSIKAQLNVQNDKVELKQMALELKEMVQELNVIANGLLISKKADYIPKYNEKRKVYDQMIKRIGETATTDDQIMWRSKLVMLTFDYAGTFDTAAKLIQDNKLTQTDLDKNMEYLYTESQKLKDEIFTYVDNFYVVYSQDAQDAIDHSQRQLDSTVNVMLAAFGIVFAAAAAIAVMLIRSFVKPIQQLQHAVKRIADGDLRHRIDSRSSDELGQLSKSFDHMVEQVTQMMANTQTIAASLAEHSHAFHGFAGTTARANADIVRAIHDISSGTEQQAIQSETSTEMIAELEQQVTMIAGSTLSVQEMSRRTMAGTELGSAAMETLSEAAERSEKMLDNVYAAMATLAESSKQIGQIVAAITDISNQTNVLSLNASIEAARAGVHGKGFLVIASEVRALSQQTSQSGKKIGALVHTLLSHMKELQGNINAAKQTMSEQSGQVKTTMSTFVTIHRSMDELSREIDHIHDKIAVAKRHNEALVRSAQQVAAIAEETAASVQEVSAASTEQDDSIRRIVSEADDIHSLSQQLFQELSRFRIDGSSDNEETEDARTEEAELSPLFQQRAGFAERAGTSAPLQPSNRSGFCAAEAAAAVQAVLRQPEERPGSTDHIVAVKGGNAAEMEQGERDILTAAAGNSPTTDNDVTNGPPASEDTIADIKSLSVPPADGSTAHSDSRAVADTAPASSASDEKKDEKQKDDEKKLVLI